MKKFFLFAAACLTAIVILVRCAKDNSSKIENSTAAVSRALFKDHLVPADEAKAMMSRYDELIGSMIENKYKEQNQKYISPNTVIYEIEPLIQFLNYLKEKGNEKVHVRFGAINGDGINQRIQGMPYHSLVFFGDKTNSNQQSRTTEDDGEYFDHGNLTPPPCGSNCTSSHTHWCYSSCTATHTHFFNW